MIFDKVENASRYMGTNPYLDEALTYMMTQDLNALPVGKTEINGDKVFITIQEADLKPADNDVYEYHKNYLDVQLDLEGTERFLFGFDTGEVDRGYVEDIGFHHCEESVSCIMGPGRFVICEKEEFHKPNVDAGLGGHVRKAVFKVLA